MARKFFAGTFAISALLALIVGAALAWSQSISSNETAQAGSLNATVSHQTYTPNNQLYPTNQPIVVLSGDITNNTPANPGIPVHIINNPGAGTVSNITPSNGGCTGISGDVNRTNGADVSPGGYSGGGWEVRLTMAQDAPNACQGNTVSYAYTVNVETP